MLLVLSIEGKFPKNHIYNCDKVDIIRGWSQSVIPRN